jgi:hypothetical protein
LAAAHRRELLEAAEHARLTANARRHSSAHQPSRLAFRRPGPRRRAVLECRPCARTR